MENAKKEIEEIIKPFRFAEKVIIANSAAKRLGENHELSKKLNRILNAPLNKFTSSSFDKVLVDILYEKDKLVSS